MRIADICPTCATFINATCIIYNGTYLSNIISAPLTSLDEIITNINNSLATPTGIGSPTFIPQYVGQNYIDSGGVLYIGLSNIVPNWGILGIISTTTTTSSTTSTTSTSTSTTSTTSTSSSTTTTTTTLP